MEIRWKYHDMDEQWTKWMLELWYLIIGFVFSKGAVSATPDDILYYRLWIWGYRGASVGFQGVLGVSGEWWCTCLVSGICCLVQDYFVCCLVMYESVTKAPSPVFSFAVSPKPCRAHWYHLLSMLQVVIAKNGMPMLMWYCDLTLGVNAQESILGELWFEHS